jgi:hypothetical protein
MYYLKLSLIIATPFLYIIGSIRAYISITDYNYTQMQLSAENQRLINVFWYFLSWLYFVAPLHSSETEDLEEENEAIAPDCSKHFDSHLFSPARKN